MPVLYRGARCLKVNELSKFSHEQTTKAQGQLEVYLHSFLTLVLDGGERSMSKLAQINHWQEPRYQLILRLSERHRRYGFSGGKFLTPSILRNSDHPTRRLATALST